MIQRGLLKMKQLMLFLLLLSIGAAQSAPSPTSHTTRQYSGREQSLRAFLQHYESKRMSRDDRTARYAAAFVDLNGDGKDETIVYLMSPGDCGSGGCSALILAPRASGFKLITQTRITRPPIRVLSTKTNGWHDLGVLVQGGGIQPGYEAKLRFNGTKYPSNPSVPPAEPLRKTVSGKIVIPEDAEGVPLYDSE